MFLFCGFDSITANIQIYALCQYTMYRIALMLFFLSIYLSIIGLIFYLDKHINRKDE